MTAKEIKEIYNKGVIYDFIRKSVNANKVYTREGLVGVSEDFVMRYELMKGKDHARFIINKKTTEFRVDKVVKESRFFVPSLGDPGVYATVEKVVHKSKKVRNREVDADWVIDKELDEQVALIAEFLYGCKEK